MKKSICLFLVFLMIGLCACGKNDTGSANASGEAQNSERQNDAPEGTVIGAIELIDMGEVVGDPDFVGNFLTQDADGGIQILDMNGNLVLTNVYGDIDSVVSDRVCIVKNGSLLGVVDAVSGKELAPCEAVDIQKLSDRYLLLCYKTGEGTDDDRFGAYYEGGSMQNYKGYGKILDLQQQRFVPNIELTKSYLQAVACGDMLCLDTDDYKITDVYDPDGNKVGSYAYLAVYPASGLALQTKEDGVYVYNGKMEQLSVLPLSEGGYEAIDGVDNMLLKEVAEDGYWRDQLISLNGNELSQVYSHIQDVIDETYIIYSTDASAGSTGVIDTSGNTVIPAQYHSIRYWEPGYFVTTDANSKPHIYDLSGKQLDSAALDYAEGIVLRQQSDGTLLILDSGECIDTEGYVKTLCLSLVLIEDQIVDVITGETVLSDVDGCLSINNDLYVWDNEAQVYHRYSVRYAR